MSSRTNSWRLPVQRFAFAALLTFAVVPALSQTAADMYHNGDSGWYFIGKNGCQPISAFNAAAQTPEDLLAFMKLEYPRAYFQYRSNTTAMINLVDDPTILAGMRGGFQCEHVLRPFMRR